MERITISIDEDLLGQLDARMADKGYSNRSEALRDILRDAFAREQVDVDGQADENETVLGCLTYVYNHTERALSRRLVEAQHHHHDLPKATLHMHIDEEDCLETTVLEGRLDEIKGLANQIIAQPGVRHGQLYLIPKTLSAHGHQGHHHSHDD